MGQEAGDRRQGTGGRGQEAGFRGQGTGRRSAERGFGNESLKVVCGNPADAGG